MPLWLIKLLPYGAAAVALALAVAFIDHRGYQRAKDQSELINTQAQLTRTEQRLAFEQNIREFEKNLQESMALKDSQLYSTIDRLNRQQSTVQPLLIKEINNDPRFSDPAAGISDGMREAINTARSASHDPCASPVDLTACAALPASTPASR